MPVHEAEIKQTGAGMHQISIVSELCTEGNLFDLLVKFGGKGLNEQQVIHIVKDVCRGLLHMHNQMPPIAHRDIKVENILLSNKKFKLCDFGSASSETLHFDSSMNENMIEDAFEHYEKYTTMMYRPPEMIDKYKRFSVSTKVDIWVSLRHFLFNFLLVTV